VLSKAVACRILFVLSVLLGEIFGGGGAKGSDLPKSGDWGITVELAFCRCRIVVSEEYA
jgi:hypothetical protein